MAVGTRWRIRLIQKPVGETFPREAQRLICQKQQEWSRSLGCGLPRLAVLGRDHRSGCSQPLHLSREPASYVVLDGTIGEQALCCRLLM